MASEKKALTIPEILKLVKRTWQEPKLRDGEVVKDKSGNVVMEEKTCAIKPEEVIDHKEYDDRVVVVTKDGQKFSAALA